MYRDLTVAVVVPAYNEEGFVGDVIEELPTFVDRAYVIDDGSTDGTWAEIQEHSKRRNESHDGEFEDLVVPIRHEHNRGVGGAIKTGYQRARDEGIEATAVLGGDHQMNPDVLTRYIDPIADGVADYTKGNRFSRAEHWQEMPRFRLFGNVVLSYLTKIASGYWQTMDSQNGYTAISLDALEATDIDGMYEYYGYCNDLLVRLNAADVRIADIPRSSEFAYTDGWKSHIDYTEYIPRVSAMLFRSFCWRLRRKYLMTSYDPVGPLYLLGIGLLGISVVGLVKSLLKREDIGTWVVSTTLGVAALFRATVLDGEANAHLETQIEDDQGVVADTADRAEGAVSPADASANETAPPHRDADAVTTDGGNTGKPPRSSDTAQPDGGYTGDSEMGYDSGDGSTTEDH